MQYATIPHLLSLQKISMPALHTTLARFCACVVFVLQTTQLCVQESTPRTKDIQIKAYDTSFYALIDKDTKAFVLYNKGIWLEGAVMLPDKSLIFSDVKANKLLRYDEKQGVSVYLPISHFQNGHTLDTKGNLIAASHGKRGIEKFENGKWVMLADPAFGIRNAQESYGGKIEQDGEYVYRYTPTSNTIVRLDTPFIKAPKWLSALS